MDGNMLDGFFEMIGCLILALVVAVICLGGVALGLFGWKTAGLFALAVAVSTGLVAIGRKIG